MKHIIFFLCLIFAVFGCAVYKNPASKVPPAFTADELSKRLHLKIGVQIPKKSQFESIKSSSERKWQYDMAVADTDRLIKTLEECQIVDSISRVDEDYTGYDMVIMNLLVGAHPKGGGQDPMILIYGGVLPLHEKSERGIHFQFLSGAEGEFKFQWTESVVVSIWAPVMTVGNAKWQDSGNAKKSATTYWYDLRSELLKVFSSRSEHN